ncbi:MAG: nucleotide sugar dehydrogenase, partial [Pirellulales bacterium]
VMSPESAELTKYVANALLSTKISFINEMANLCQRMGADINDVRRGIGHDSRIGFAFLFPGVGYGGSCFPKDVRALIRMAEELGIEPRVLRAVDTVNENQKKVMIEAIAAHFEGNPRGKTIAVWGLAFKPRTDDIREAPALVLIDWLLSQGASVQVHDPEAMANVRRQYGDKLSYCDKPLEAIQRADALAIMTEWGDYQRPEFKEMFARMRSPVIFDGRNLYEPWAMQRLGFTYHSIGRLAVG